VAEQSDLFEAALERHLAEHGPLASRMRPKSLDEMVGQERLLAPGRPLRALIEADRLSSAILWGPPGTGKTTLAQLVAGATKKAFVSMSAVAAGVKDVREAVDAARRRLAVEGRGTVLFLDEVHRFNRTQQDALLPSVESGELVLIGATTENPFFSVNGPLLSRSSLFRLEALSERELLVLLKRALERERATVADDALALLARLSEGDARSALNGLEVAMALASTAGRAAVSLEDVEAARSTRALRYGEDEHYDVVSAFIKSVRGSDPDAGLYWLARMLEAGEDARFIARRLVILASEDVGMADPQSLLVADAAARAVELVGLPEAQLNLAHAVIHLANAPKSNSVTAALGKARSDVQELAGGEVPKHLRDSHYKGAARLGHGKGYVYPHGEPGGWVAQQYRPGLLEGRVYWEPTGRGEDLRKAARGPAGGAS
jgi:putative ATPase